MAENALTPSEQSYEQLQAQVMRELHDHLPMNDYGLPLGIYRVDLLPFHDYDPTAGTIYFGVVEEEEEEAKQEYENKNDEPRTKEPQEPEWEEVSDDDGDLADLEATLESGISIPTRIEPQRIAGFKASDLDRAFIQLQYDEGYPAFTGGEVFWNQMPFEPSEAFQAFELYRQMGRGGVKGEDGTTDFADPWSTASGERSIDILANTLHAHRGAAGGAVALTRIRNQCLISSQLYYWKMRAKAYDLFKVAQHRKQQELRAIELQDDHYIIARRLLGKLLNYFENEEDFWEMLTPKVGIDMLKTVTQMQRVSAGLPAQGPLTPTKGETAGSSFSIEHIMRQISNGNQAQEEIDDHVIETQHLLDKALADPETTQDAQALILKLMTGGDA